MREASLQRLNEKEKLSPQPQRSSPKKLDVQTLVLERLNTQKVETKIKLELQKEELALRREDLEIRKQEAENMKSMLALLTQLLPKQGNSSKRTKNKEQRTVKRKGWPLFNNP